MSGANGQRPPAPAHSIEAEQAVLGAAIRDPDALGWLAANLAWEDFYRPEHRTIAGLLLELHRDGLAVDPVTVLTALAERRALQDLGGGSYLHELDAAVSTAANVGWYGRKILAAARMRQTYDRIVQLQQFYVETARDGWDAERVAAFAVEQFQQLLDGGDDSGVGGPPELLEALRETRDRRLRGDKVAFGLERLDMLTGGMEPGQMVVVAGRPGAGKSGFGLQVAAHLAEARRVAFVSYEMSRSQVGRRIMARLAQVTTDAAVMRVGDDRLAGARDAFELLDLEVLYARPDLDRLLAQLRGLHARRRFDLIVVDYLQLVPVDERRYNSRQEQVAAISRSLKLLAGRLDTVVMPLAQLNRNADGREPVLADLKESGQIEQDADMVLFLHEAERATKAIVAKHRDGAQGSVPLAFDKPRATFADIPEGAGGWEGSRDPSGTR